MKILGPKYQNFWEQTVPDSFCEKFVNKLAINRRHDFTRASFWDSRIRWNTEKALPSASRGQRSVINGTFAQPGGTTLVHRAVETLQLEGSTKVGGVILPPDHYCLSWFFAVFWLVKKLMVCETVRGFSSSSIQTFLKLNSSHFFTKSVENLVLNLVYLEVNFYAYPTSTNLLWHQKCLCTFNNLTDTWKS